MSGCDGDGDGGGVGGSEKHALWRHLPLLLRANSKESVEYILQALWRTRNTGLDSADSQIFCQILQLQHDKELDPLLICLRILIRKCVRESINKDDIQKLFPDHVLPELRRLLTLLLQKFQREWHEDVLKDDEVKLPHLKEMTCSSDMPNLQWNDPGALINLKLQKESQSNMVEVDVKFQLSKDNVETTLKTMYCIRDQLSEDSERPRRNRTHANKGHSQQSDQNVL